MKNIFVKSFAAMALASLLSGCIAPNGEPDNTGSGALIGGATGAIIGAAADRNSGAGALIGGAAGLIAGGLIGHSVDQQAQVEKQRQQYAQQTYVPPPPGPPPSLEDIKGMAKSGVSDDVIISQISNTRAAYHLDANAIIDLSNAGVSQKVINFMIGTASNADNVVVSQAPPPAQVEPVVVAPSPGFVWVGGGWVWNGGWVWIGGHWVQPPYPHAVWVNVQWYRGPSGWYCSPGHWR